MVVTNDDALRKPSAIRLLVCLLYLIFNVLIAQVLHSIASFI
jgi:hypothetical protein